MYIYVAVRAIRTMRAMRVIKAHLESSVHFHEEVLVCHGVKDKLNSAYTYTHTTQGY